MAWCGIGHLDQYFAFKSAHVSSAEDLYCTCCPRAFDLISKVATPCKISHTDRPRFAYFDSPFF